MRLPGLFDSPTPDPLYDIEIVCRYLQLAHIDADQESALTVRRRMPPAAYSSTTPGIFRTSVKPKRRKSRTRIG